MNKLPEIFSNVDCNLKRLEKIAAIRAPRKRYLIAMTPRSGSSYLCDVMKKVKRFGTPDEVLNQDLIPGLLKKHPGRTPEEYLRNALRSGKSRNGVSGLKASWYQFENFEQAMGGGRYLSQFSFIYLTRRDLAAQAVSLYKATASSVFHTNIRHRGEALSTLAALEYDFDAINQWHAHIAEQENGWQRYFYEQRIFPLCITYEDIEADLLRVLKRIAMFIGVTPGNVSMPEEPSVFRKVGDDRNLEWARRFSMERDAREHSLSPNDNLTGDKRL